MLIINLKKNWIHFFAPNLFYRKKPLEIPSQAENDKKEKLTTNFHGQTQK